MDQMILVDANGRSRKVDLYEIETALGVPADNKASNCILITAKKVEGEWQVVDVVGIHGNGPHVGLYFKSWFQEIDGKRSHRSFLLGATHYGTLWCEDEMMSRAIVGSFDHLRQKLA